MGQNGFIRRRTVHEDTVHQHAILPPGEGVGRAFGLPHVHAIKDLEAVAQGVDGRVVLAGVGLQRARQEALREEEARKPEGMGCSSCQPCLDEGQPEDKVVDPGAQWLKRRIPAAQT